MEIQFITTLQLVTFTFVSMKLHSVILALIISTSSLTVKAQNDSTKKDFVGQKWYKSTVFKTVVAPVVLIGYGVSITGVNGFPYSSRQVQAYTTKVFPGFHTSIDDFLAFSPPALALGLKTAGVKTEHNILDGFLLYAFSFGLSEGLVEGLKYTVHEKRPDGSDNLSFPSAHTSAAFAGAEFLHQEYINQSGWYSAAGYSLGAATGVLRLLNDKHWLSDVLVGAGIGILSTKVVYLVYPIIKKKLARHKGQSGYYGLKY